MDGADAIAAQVTTTSTSLGICTFRALSLYLLAAPDAPRGRQLSSRRKWPRPQGDVDGADAISDRQWRRPSEHRHNGRQSIRRDETSRHYPELNS